MDIIIPLGESSRDNGDWELKYCLRSLETNFLEIGKVYIIGTYLPFWIDNVEHIFCEDIFRYNKDGNIIRKVLEACNNKNVSEDFLRISDDQLILQLTESKYIKSLYDYDLKDKVEEWSKDREKVNRWYNRAINTFEFLNEKGLTTYNYDSHLPTIVNKKSFVGTIGKSNGWDKIPKDVTKSGGYVINTLYFNQLELEHHFKNKIGVRIKNRLTKEEILDLIQGKVYLNHEKCGVNEDLKEVIYSLFPNKSKFEV